MKKLIIISTSEGLAYIRGNRYMRAFVAVKDMVAPVFEAVVAKLILAELPDLAALVAQTAHSVCAAERPKASCGAIDDLIARLMAATATYAPCYTVCEIACDRLRILRDGFSAPDTSRPRKSRLAMSKAPPSSGWDRNKMTRWLTNRPMPRARSRCAAAPGPWSR
jgi:hypothetical protein